MRLLPLSAALAVLAVVPVQAASVTAASNAGLGPGPDKPKPSAEPSKTTSTLPCTASATSGAFYDLRPDTVVPPVDGAKKSKSLPTADYVARGHDYGANFTLNICAAVVAPVANVQGVDRALWANVSAYYEHDGQAFSLGQQSSSLTARGRELVLQYTGGSPCPDPGADWPAHATLDGQASLDPATPTATTRRKSATFAFLCDRDPLETTAHVSFVGTPDQCAYFFKVRSPHACAMAEPHKPGSVGPGGVFAIIAGVALLVYFIGGVAYNRAVGHARGWRQLPNHTIWLGIWSFVRDYYVILTSSCARLVPQHRGYQSLSTSPTRSREDENRLIDQLDEEWDD